MGAHLPPPGPLDVRRMALFLDLDGTLAGIEVQPSLVRPDSRRNRLLTRLSEALEGRLAVVSGRALADVDRILGGGVRAVAAVHGLDRRTASGERFTAEPPAGIGEARGAAAEALAEPAGLLIEDKGLAFAIHYREAPQLASEVSDVATRIAGAFGLELQPGSMVIELRAPGHDKGDAVEAFMAEPPFEGAVPVFVGDDLTDEDGFDAARGLGGFGVLVGPSRRTAAGFRLENVQAVLGWLSAAVPEEAAA
jgi:trehalose 6-phosphate phosphatase